MHKFLLNQLELEIGIRPQSAVLIKSGTEEGADPTLPNMNFIRTSHPRTGEPTVYLPGSSLKGVIRSHAERIIRTVLGEAASCDPLGKSACGDKGIFKTDQRRKTVMDGAEVYRNLCAACKLFGHTVMASRFTIADAFPAQEINALPVRQMVAIDRRSGGSVNTFTMEALTEGVFSSRIVMRNFESWQLGVIALVLRDLRLGRVRIGFGKSRGLGLVAVDLHSMTLSYEGNTAGLQPTRYIYGVGELLNAMGTESARELRDNYGFFAAPLENAHLPESTELIPDWASTQIELKGDLVVEAALGSQVATWRRYQEQR